MKRIVVSWIAWRHDFNDDRTLNESGPNSDMHRFFFDKQQHDRHLLLSTAVSSDTRSEHFASWLRGKFPGHTIELHYLGISDPVDIKEVYEKTLAFMLPLKNQGLDVFFSPGTSIMQVTWYMLHNSGDFDTRIIQGRKPEYVKEGMQRFWETHFTLTAVPQRLLISSETTDKVPPDYFKGDSLKPIYEKAKLVAGADRVPVLITGASGTGKEHLAATIHAQSARARQKYFTLNCSALRDDLLESRLFGYRKGAFTGATQHTEGILKSCDGGTLFLDEIGDISPYMQQALLRVLQSGEFLPVGSTTTEKANVRIIAATHRDLEELCNEGRFRWDLYYRLAVSTLHLPTLQQRGPQELEQTFRHLLRHRAHTFGRETPAITQEAMQKIVAFDFPGNVRQLINLVDNLLIYGHDTISPGDLPQWLTRHSTKAIPTTLDEKIRQWVNECYQANNENLAATARELDVAVNTVKKYLKGR